MAEMLDNLTLVDALASRGVRHLRAAETGAGKGPVGSEAVILGLARHSQPRFREALIPLFLRCPEYASLAPGLAAALQPPADAVLRHMYTAAVYLQRLWRGTLRLYLGSYALLPDLFGQSEFGLPDPDDGFGEAGLRALAQLFREKTGDEWLGAYQSIMAGFLNQIKLEWQSGRAS